MKNLRYEVAQQIHETVINARFEVKWTNTSS